MDSLACLHAVYESFDIYKAVLFCRSAQDTLDTAAILDDMDYANVPVTVFSSEQDLSEERVHHARLFVMQWDAFDNHIDDTLFEHVNVCMFSDRDLLLKALREAHGRLREALPQVQLMLHLG